MKYRADRSDAGPGWRGERGLRLGVLLLTVVSLAAPPGALAQTTTSTVEGTVRDAAGAVIPNAQLAARSRSVGAERVATSDANGFYRITALPAGTYTLTASHQGFSTRTFESLEVTLNRTLTLDVELEAGGVRDEIEVDADPQLIDPNASSTGATVTPLQIAELPVNGRNYLDLLQLVPGVSVNRQADPGSDAATPVLGERGGNTNFLIDGLPNKDTFEGGPAAQFNQETIAEFQVLTTGYKAEFGQASGAVVNVITKSGGNDYRGVASLFHRNSTRRTRSTRRGRRPRSCSGGTTAWPSAGRSSKTRRSSSRRPSGSPRAGTSTSPSRRPPPRSCGASRRNSTTPRASSRRGRSCASTRSSGATAWRSRSTTPTP
jgi:hypothetical protein